MAVCSSYERSMIHGHAPLATLSIDFRIIGMTSCQQLPLKPSKARRRARVAALSDDTDAEKGIKRLNSSSSFHHLKEDWIDLRSLQTSSLRGSLNLVFLTIDRTVSRLGRHHGPSCHH